MSERARWAVEYAVVRAVAAVVGHSPRWIGSRAGRLLGDLAFLVDRRHREVALANLEAAYPDSDEAWRREVARGSFRHLGRLLTEIVSQRPEVRRLLPTVTFEGWEWLQQIEQAGKGYFLLSGHFGNWERVAHLQAALGHPLWMVTRPLDNPYLERYLARLRESTGNRVVHKRNAVREVVRGLRQGKGIAFVIDQNFGEPGRHFVPFFGRPAATTPALGSLAARLQIPILPVFAFPEPQGRYRIVYGPPIFPPDSGDREADALTLSELATARIEEAVRAQPEAWFWMHQRWRTRPEVEMETGKQGNRETGKKGDNDPPPILIA